MRVFVLLAALATPLAPAFAEPVLPDPSKLAEAATPEFLFGVVLASVAGEHCEGFTLDESELNLLRAAIPPLVETLAIPQETYDLEHEGLAFANIFIDETCAVDGPKARPELDKLTAMGGVPG